MKEQILTVQRMQDYIEAHLDEKIGLSELASASLFSPWYSYHLFQEYIVYCWDDNNPRIQLEPRGNRGYIELKAVKQK